MSDLGGPSAERWRHVLGTHEQLHAQAEGTDGIVAVTDKRVVVQRGKRLALDAPIEELRRIQFDVERARPATMVIVPDHPSRQPEVLAIDAENLDDASRLLAVVGRRLAQNG